MTPESPAGRDPRGRYRAPPGGTAPADVIHTFLESLAGWLDVPLLPPPSVGAITRGGLPFEEQAKRLRSLKPPQEAPEGDPLERDRAYALVDTAVRQWIAAALRHKRLEDRYTAQSIQ